MKSVAITCFSDVLCIWAYIAQPRIELLKRTHGEAIALETRFCSVFGDTARKIRTDWKDRGDYQGFNAHLRHAAESFPEIPLHQDIWLTVRPATSTSAHLFLTAMRRSEISGRLPGGITASACLAFRRAFFEHALDIARLDVQRDICRQLGADPSAINGQIEDGSAFAALASDYKDADLMGIQGSPTFVLNSGRQKLYGNVGYRILEANVQELLREPKEGQASWC
jgi:predicted DsbA family dithiol-disulfide isomerase